MPTRLQNGSHENIVCCFLTAKVTSKMCILTIVIEIVSLINLMQTKSLFDNYKFYFYFDLLLLAACFIPLLGFFRYSNDDHPTKRNCLPIMCLFMTLVTSAILLETSFLLFKDLTTIIK